MALPPTKLKDLLYRCRDTDAIFDELRAAGCLARSVNDNRDAILDLVAQVEHGTQELTPNHERPVGPNHVDLIADALESAGMLSRHGRKLAAEMA